MGKFRITLVQRNTYQFIVDTSSEDEARRVAAQTANAAMQEKYLASSVWDIDYVEEVE